MERTDLPDLPLMLAGVPRLVADMLREAGVPVESLPRVPLLASGAGRFVLFDGARPTSVCLARRAARQGLLAIDVRPLMCGLAEFEAAVRSTSVALRSIATVPNARMWLERLKTELESRGGLWLRLGDYPFPWQSALCVALEHVQPDLRELSEWDTRLGPALTHFVSTRLRGTQLDPLRAAGPIELGWRIAADDCEDSIRGTASHWRTRIERFRAIGVLPRGLLLTDPDLEIPASRNLWTAGFEYASRQCQDASGNSCDPESVSSDHWVQIPSAEFPDLSELSEWVAEYYQSGCPLILNARTDRPTLAEDFARLEQLAGRCSLLWRATCREFAAWRRSRRRMSVRVWRQEGGYRVHLAGAGTWQPAVEIWRGAHVATLPLGPKPMFVADDGLVYLRSHKRAAAGCSIPTDAILELTAHSEPQPQAA